MAPELVASTTSTYRYRFIGTFGNGPVNVDFLDRSFADMVGNAGTASLAGFNVQFQPSLWIDTPQPVVEGKKKTLNFITPLTGPIARGVSEGQLGTKKSTFAVTLSAPSSTTTMVSYATADGAATLADNDYRAKSGTLRFRPGVKKQTITVLVNGDGVYEPNETFQVLLSDPVNAALARPIGTGTIKNDDRKPKAARAEVWLGKMAGAAAAAARDALFGGLQRDWLLGWAAGAADVRPGRSTRIAEAFDD